MLMLQILAAFLSLASIPDSEQAGLTCESNEIVLPEGITEELRLVDGFSRTSREDPVFLGSRQNLTVIHGGRNSSDYVGVCYSTSSGGCYISGNDQEECDNFLRGVTALGESCNSGSCRVLACGTNARLPRCSFCNYTNYMLDCRFVENVPPQDLPYNGSTYTSCTSSNVDGGEVFQLEKNNNATFVYDDESGKLFYGVMRSANSEISIIGLASIDKTSGAISGNVITRVDSEKMVATEAHFVGTPFVRGDFAYILFREPALEVASLSNGQDQTIKTYYSRIARICTNDVGTTVSSTQILTSYLKQRLVCCIMEDGECLEEFNEIQDFVLDDDDTTIHAIFTNAENASPASALCVFNLNTIDQTFSTGSFFGASGSTTNDRWREYDGAVISPRPGFSCSDPNTGETNFQRDYNLMLDPAEQMNADPFYLEGDRFSNLEIEYGDRNYTISSERGCLYRFGVDSNETDLGSPCSTPVVDKPIQDLELMPDNNYLITAGSSVFDIGNCYDSSLDGEEPHESPPLGHYMARPNSIFEFIVDSMDFPTITCNNELVDSNNNAYLLQKMETLDTTNKLTLYRILILYDCSVTFADPDKNYTIEPYDDYTKGELDQRCDEWENANMAYKKMNDTDTCGKAHRDNPGNFSSSILLDYTLVQDCENCAYNGCTENTCTP